MVNKKGIASTVGVIVGIIIFIAMAVALAGFDVVDASHVGVKNRFGVILGTMQPGMQWTGLFTQVEQYDLRVRKMTIDMAGEQSAVDKDGQSIFATIQINYRLKPDNVENAYKRIGPDPILAEILNLDGIVREGFKDTTSKRGALEIVQNRQEIKEQAIERIQANFPAEYFNLENVIVSNIDFGLNFKNAIEAKKTNEELAKAKEKEVDIQKFEADKAIEKARGLSESKKLAADALAYERLELAKSEAESLRLKRQELTAIMVQNNWIDAWDGKLPTFMMGDSSGMLLNLNPMEITQQSIQPQTTQPIQE